MKNPKVLQKNADMSHEQLSQVNTKGYVNKTESNLLYMYDF